MKWWKDKPERHTMKPNFHDMKPNSRQDEKWQTNGLAMPFLGFRMAPADKVQWRQGMHRQLG